MVPIFIHKRSVDGKIGYAYDEFKSNFLSICEEHHQSDRALAFVFILYDLRNAAVAKVLEDIYYWNALDHLSGTFLSIYHIDTSQAEGARVSRRLHDPLRPASTVVGRHIGAPPENTPTLLFFQVADGMVTDSLMIPLIEKEVESSFSEITSYVSAAVRALKLIQNENRNNRTEVFRELERSIRSVRFRTRIKRVFNEAIPVIKFVSIFKG